MTRVVGQGFLRATVGMRVAMNEGYKKAGAGTVASVQDESSCSVQWDSGRLEQCLLTGKHGMYQLVLHDTDRSTTASLQLDASILSMQSTISRSSDHIYDQLWAPESRSRSRTVVEQTQSPRSPGSPRVLSVHLPSKGRGRTADSPLSPRVLAVRRSRDSMRAAGADNRWPGRGCAGVLNRQAAGGDTGERWSEGETGIYEGHSQVGNSPRGRILFRTRENERRILSEPLKANSEPRESQDGFKGRCLRPTSFAGPLPIGDLAEMDPKARWSALQALIYELDPSRVSLTVPSLPDLQRLEHSWMGADGKQHMVARSQTTLGLGVVGLKVDFVGIQYARLQ
jgi:hypothetical protein